MAFESYLVVPDNSGFQINTQPCCTQTNLVHFIEFSYNQTEITNLSLTDVTIKA